MWQSTSRTMPQKPIADTVGPTCSQSIPELLNTGIFDLLTEKEILHTSSGLFKIKLLSFIKMSICGGHK